MHSSIQTWLARHKLRVLRNRKLEGGFAVSVQLTYYSVLLFLAFGFIFDIGGLAYAYTTTQSIVNAAAQQVAKGVRVGVGDTGGFDRSQFVNLDTHVVSTSAQGFVNEASNGAISRGAVNASAQLLDATPSQPCPRAIARVTANVVVPMPILGHLVGMAPVPLQITGYAEATYGILAECQ